MARYSKKNKVSDITKNEAIKIARSTQKPGQSKEQTKLIAQGIQKGIEQYKNKNREKSRELDKKLKKVSASKALPVASEEAPSDTDNIRCNKLAWGLLIVSWISFVSYIVLIQ